MIDDVIREALLQLAQITGRSYEEIADIAMSLRYESRCERYGDELRRLVRELPDPKEHFEDVRRVHRDDFWTRREREAATAMHFGGHRRPRREARQHGDPLRHHRLRGFRRASRRDQTDIRTEAR